MTYTRQGNKITYKKGRKPAAIKSAQRDVRDIYEYLCNQSAPRSPALAQAIYLSQFSSEQRSTLATTAPTFTVSVYSASRAYSRLGTDLLKFQMYSMDLTVPVEDLTKFLPPEQVEELKATGLAEFVFQARESA